MPQPLRGVVGGAGPDYAAGMTETGHRARDGLSTAWLVLRESVVSFGANRGLESAATLAYYGFLSLMPFLLLCFFVLGLVLGSSEEILLGVESVMTDLFPSFHRGILVDLTNLTRTKVWGVVSVVVLLWSMTPFAGALRSSVYRIFKTDRRLKFLKAKLVDATAILALMTLFTALVAWRVFVTVRHTFNVDVPLVGRVLEAALPFAATLLVLASIYAWFAPVRPRRAHVLAGATVATVLLSAMRPLFGLLLEFNPNYGYAFGSLKAMFVLIVWVYYTFAVILFGAEVMCNARRKEALLLRGLFLGLPLPRGGNWRLVDRFVRRVEPGEVLFREGDRGSEMFYVQAGAVELRKGGRPLLTVKPGGYFGELSMLIDTPRTAEAVGLEPGTALIVVTQDNLDTLLRENPAIVRSILKEMAQRLKNTSERIQAVESK